MIDIAQARLQLNASFKECYIWLRLAALLVRCMCPSHALQPEAAHVEPREISYVLSANHTACYQVLNKKCMCRR